MTVKRNFLLLLHPAFIISLVLLLVNDFYLKPVYNNSLTGKLSDFAGLFAFTVFWISFFPKRRKGILLFSALFFCWWKSPLSSGFIAFMNNGPGIPVERVVDYSDLLALTVIPFVLLLKETVYRLSFFRKTAVWFIVGISLFSFSATSMVRSLYYSSYEENETFFGENFFTSLPEKDVLGRLTGNRNNYRVDSVRFLPVHKNDSLFYRVKNINDTLWVYTPNNNDSSLFIKRHVAPYYVIPQVIILGDTLNNVQVRISPGGKKKKPTRVVIESFRLANRTYRGYYDNVPNRKGYREYFRNILK